MRSKDKKVLLCNCENTIPFDKNALSNAFGGNVPNIHSQLCGTQSGSFESLLGEDADIIVACGRQSALFEEIRSHQDGDTPDIAYVDIRETAGWGSEGAKATPKMAALLAQAALSPRPAETIRLESEGTVLILGEAEAAIDAAKALLGRLSPVVMIERPGDAIPGQIADFPILNGRLKTLNGHFGAFSARFSLLATLRASSRGELQFDTPIADIEETFDLILDLTADEPLFNSPRDGYFKIDPQDRAALFEAYFKLSDMVGEFNKTRYAQINGELCAHTRNKITGCTRCIDSCGSSAISSSPVGNSAVIDPHACTGCGDCSAVCPTGAVSYALPYSDDLIRRLQVLSDTYSRAGGKRPVLLVHDADHGSEMLDLLGQCMDGLPATVIPFAINRIALFGHDLMLAAVAAGFGSLCILAPDSRYRDDTSIRSEIALARTLLDGLSQKDATITLLEMDDPSALDESLRALPKAADLPQREIMATGRKRERTLHNMHQFEVPGAPIVLEQGAPYGTLNVNADGCTLCMSCVGACPTDALKSNPDQPILSFVENDCVQCGICRKTCPEKVISLEPRLDLSEAAATPRIIKQEEPHQCPSCGATFGVKSALDRMVEKLRDHPQFQDPERLQRLLLCPDCRVRAEAGDTTVLNFGERPKPRTTDDYL